MSRPFRTLLLDLLLIALLVLGIILRASAAPPDPIPSPWTPPTILPASPTLTVTPGGWSASEFNEIPYP